MKRISDVTHFLSTFFTERNTQHHAVCTPSQLRLTSAKKLQIQAIDTEQLEISWTFDCTACGSPLYQAMLIAQLMVRPNRTIAETLHCSQQSLTIKTSPTKTPPSTASKSQSQQSLEQLYSQQMNDTLQAEHELQAQRQSIQESMQQSMLDAEAADFDPTHDQFIAHSVDPSLQSLDPASVQRAASQSIQQSVNQSMQASVGSQSQAQSSNQTVTQTNTQANAVVEQTDAPPVPKKKKRKFV
jgi:hypothetical protein